MPRTGLSEFAAVLKDFRKLHSIALKGAVAAPIADIWLKLGPPPSKTVSALTSLLEFLALVWVFHFWSNLPKEKLGLRMKIALGLFLLGMMGSFFMLERFSISPGSGQEKVIEGFTLRPDITPVVNASYTPEQTLRDSEYDAEKVWTRESIATMRSAIVFLWIGSFSCVAIFLASFIIAQRRQDSAVSRNPSAA